MARTLVLALPFALAAAAGGALVLGFGGPVRFGFEVDVDVLDVESFEELLRASAVLAPLGAVDDGR